MTPNLNMRKCISLLVMLLIGAASCEACDIMYVREPVSMVLCNPYSGGSDFQLQCVVQAPATAGPRLDIVWLFTNTSEHTVQINMNTFPTPPFNGITSQNRTVMNGELIEITSTLALMREFSHPSHAGRYFCQVLVDGLTSSLSPSNAQTYSAAESIFNDNTCGTAGEQFNQAATRCAGNISFSTTTQQPPTDSTTSMFRSDPPISSPGPVSALPPAIASPTSILTTEMTTPLPSPQSGPQSLSLWVYVLVGVAAVFAIIILILMISCIKFGHLKYKMSASIKESLTEPDVVITTNIAYGTSEGMKIDVDEAYEVIDLHRNDANKQHTVSNDPEYAEITN